jgi:hypothetical protein
VKYIWSLLLAVLGIGCLWLGWQFFVAISSHWQPHWPTGQGCMKWPDWAEEHSRLIGLSVGPIITGCLMIIFAGWLLFSSNPAPAAKKAH